MQQETSPLHLRQYHPHVHARRIREAAALTGVGVDALGRRLDGGRLHAERDEPGRRIILGPDREESEGVDP